MQDEIVIEMTGPGRGTVTIDGVPLKGVCSVDFHGEPDTANTVRLGVLARVLTIKTPSGVVFDVSSVDPVRRQE